MASSQGQGKLLKKENKYFRLTVLVAALKAEGILTLSQSGICQHHADATHSWNKLLTVGSLATMPFSFFSFFS